MDDDGRILLTTPVGLLIGDSKRWQMVDRSVGLRGTVYAAFEDRQHSLWIGLAGRGLAQWLGYREWESYSTESGLASDLVYEILPQDDGSLLVGTEAGLFRGERRPIGMSFRSVPGLSGFAVHSVRRSSKGDIWIGTETRGVARIDAQTGKAEWFGERQGLADRAAYTLRFDHEQRLWVTTEAGLFMAMPPYRRFSRITELPSTRMWAVSEGSDGTVWAGGAGGLYEFAAGRWKNLTRADGLSNTEVLSLGAGPDGAVWVGYRFGGGIDRVRPQAGGVAIEKGVQRRGSDGLIYFLEFDHMGRLWAGTEHGVDVWDGAALEPLRHERWPGLGRLQPECIRRRARRNCLDWNKRRTLAFQANPASRSPSSAHGCFHQACEWADRCVRTPQSIVWQPRKLSHRKVFRAECDPVRTK